MPENVVYALGPTNVVKLSSGGSWSALAAPPAGAEAISLAADGSGVLFLTDSTNLYEYDGAGGWTSHGALPHGSTGIHARTEDEVWIAGGATWITRWTRSGGYTSWQEGTGSPFWTPEGVFAWTDQHVIVSGRSSSGRTWVYRTIDGGSTWTRVLDASSGGSAGIFTLDGVTWWLARDNGALWVSVDSGASFSALGNISSSGDLFAVWAASATDVWVAGGGSGSDNVIGRWNGSAFVDKQTWNDVDYNGVSGVAGLSASEVYWPRNQTGNIVKWNGSVFSQVGGGAGTFPSQTNPNMMTSGLAPSPTLVTNRDPDDTESDVIRDTWIEFDVTSAGEGIDRFATTITLNGILAWTGDAPTAPYEGTRTPITDGYHYRVRPLVIFAEGIPVNVAIHAENPLAVSVDDAYSFNVGEARVGIIQRIAKYFDPAGLATWNFDNLGAADDDLKDRTVNGYNLVWNAGSRSHATSPSGMVGMRFDNNRNMVAPNVEDFRIALERLGGGDASLTVEVILGVGVKSGARIFGCWGSGESEATNFLYDLYPTAGHWQSFNETGNGGNITIDFPNVPEANPNAAEVWPLYVALTVDAGGTTRNCYVSQEGSAPLLSQETITTAAMKEELGSNVQRFYVGAGFTGTIIGLRVWAEEKDEAFLQASYESLLTTSEAQHTRSEARQTATYEDAYELPTAGGPAKHTDAAGRGAGQLIPGPPDQSTGSVGPFDVAAIEDTYDFPSAGGPPRHTGVEVGLGQRVPGPAEQNPESPTIPTDSGAYEDALAYLLEAVPEFNSASFDIEGHPHFLSADLVAFHATYYNAAVDPWATPTLNNFSGFAQNGKKYTSGVEDGPTVWAGWATESPTDDRSSRADFPDEVLIVTCRYEVVIFDLDSYDGAINSLKVWMRFKWNDADYMCLGRGSLNIRDLKMANGTMVAATRYDSSPAVNGGVHAIDFKATGTNWLFLIRTDGHWESVGAKSIANRNEASLFASIGGVYVDSEYIYRIAVRSVGTNGLYIAHAGEDTEDPQVTYLEDNVFQWRGRLYGEDVGVANLYNEWYKQVLFDEQGWLWASRDNRIYRHGLYYTAKVLQQDVDDKLRPHVDLPHDVLSLVAARDYLYAGTEAGVYIIERSTLNYWLAYTAVGGGGRGRLNTAGTGELLKGRHSEPYRLSAISFDTSSYLAVPQGYHMKGAVTIIRLYDDFIVGEYEAPALAEDGAYFAVIAPG